MLAMLAEMYFLPRSLLLISTTSLDANCLACVALTCLLNLAELTALSYTFVPKTFVVAAHRSFCDEKNFEDDCTADNGTVLCRQKKHSCWFAKHIEQRSSSSVRRFRCSDEIVKHYRNRTRVLRVGGSVRSIGTSSSHESHTTERAASRSICARSVIPRACRLPPRGRAEASNGLPAQPAEPAANARSTPRAPPAASPVCQLDLAPPAAAIPGPKIPQKPPATSTLPPQAPGSSSQPQATSISPAHRRSPAPATDTRDNSVPATPRPPSPTESFASVGLDLVTPPPLILLRPLTTDEGRLIVDTRGDKRRGTPTASTLTSFGVQLDTHDWPSLQDGSQLRDRPIAGMASYLTARQPHIYAFDPQFFTNLQTLNARKQSTRIPSLPNGPANGRRTDTTSTPRSCLSLSMNPATGLSQSSISPGAA